MTDDATTWKVWKRDHIKSLMSMAGKLVRTKEIFYVSPVGTSTSLCEVPKDTLMLVTAVKVEQHAEITVLWGDIVCRVVADISPSLWSYIVVIT